MPPRSKIERLDPRIREAVDELVRGGRATIDEIVERLRAMLGENAPSRAAVGRYAQRATAKMQRYREAQEVAKVWIAKLDQEPEGDVGRLLAEMLRTVAFEALGQLGDDGATVEAGDVMLLARAIKDLASADKLNADRQLKIRKELAQELEQKVEEQAKSGAPLTADAFRSMIREVYG